jgi:serine/threonine protein kinase
MKCRRCYSEVALGVPVCPHCRAEQDHFVERVLGEYRLERRIGKGAFGWVYAAKGLTDGREVAVKLLRAEHVTQNPEQNSMVQRFRQEATLIKRLAHPDAVKIYATGETDDGLFWIAMEFLDGDTLHNLLLRRGRLPVEECMALLDAVFDVLHEAHQKGIIHRDLKPDNLMVLHTGTTKILDFGISKAVELDTLTQTGMALGTPAYMPKEQWEGSKHITPATDIYSLGLILYKALAGSLPFEATTAAAWMNRHCMTEPKPLIESLSGCSVSMNTVVMRSLQKDPKHRYQDALSFRDDLHKALRAEPITTPITEAPVMTLEEEAPASAGSTQNLPNVVTPRVSHAAPLLWLVSGLLGASLLGVAYLLSTRAPTAAPVAPLAPLPASLIVPVQSLSVSTSATLNTIASASTPTINSTQAEQWLNEAASLADQKKWREAAALARKANHQERSAQYEREEQAQTLVIECEKSAKKQQRGIDSAMAACAKIARDTKVYAENQELIASVAKNFKAKHYAQAKLAISSERLTNSRQEMHLLEPFIKEDDVEALQLKYFALEQTCKRRILRACK